MNIKKIVAGRVYETDIGYGPVLQVGGTHPPSVKINIQGPFPRGINYVTPRQVLKEKTDGAKSEAAG